MAKLSLSTPQEVWDFYCTVGNFEKSEVDEKAESWITDLFPKFSEEDFKKVIRKSAKTPAYALFDESFFRATLETLAAEEETARLRKEMEEMRTIDRTAASQLDLLTQSVSMLVADKVRESATTDIKEDITKWVNETYGPITRTVTLVSANGQKVDGVIHKKFHNVERYVSLGKPVMMVGPAGSGKNILAKQLATAFDMEYHQCNAIQQSFELTGFVDGYGKYQDTEFYKACKSASNGIHTLLLLDELDGCIPEALLPFNDAMSSGVYQFPNGEVLEFKQNLHFLAAANTFGTGATMQYVGRNQLDAATLNRYRTVAIDYDPIIEEALCPDAKLLGFIRDFRNAINEAGILHVVSYRDISSVYDTFTAFPNDDKLEIIEECLVKNLEPNDLATIVNRMEENEYQKMLKRISLRG